MISSQALDALNVLLVKSSLPTPLPYEESWASLRHEALDAAHQLSHQPPSFLVDPSTKAQIWSLDFRLNLFQ
jgi:hypothetical protein